MKQEKYTDTEFMIILELWDNQKSIKELNSIEESSRHVKFNKKEAHIRNTINKMLNEEKYLVRTERGKYQLNPSTFDNAGKKDFILWFIEKLSWYSYLSEIEKEKGKHFERISILSDNPVFIKLVENYLRSIGQNYIEDLREATESFEDNLLADSYKNKLFKKLGLLELDDWVDILKKNQPDEAWKFAINNTHNEN